MSSFIKHCDNIYSFMGHIATMRPFPIFLFIFIILTYVNCSPKISIEKHNFIKKSKNDGVKTPTVSGNKTELETSELWFGQQWQLIMEHVKGSYINRTTQRMEIYKLYYMNGPNICEREVNYVKESWVNYQVFLRDMNELFNLYNDAMVGRINESAVNDSLTNFTVKILECCTGYTTDDIMNAGCDKEINNSLLTSYNISLSQKELKNSTILYEKSGKKVYTLPGIQDLYEFPEEHVLLTENNEKFVMKINLNSSIVSEAFKNNGSSSYRPKPDDRISLNCAFKHQTLRTNDSIIHLFDGRLEAAAENVLDILGSNQELSMFYNILGDEFRKVLRETNKSTIFAFTNEAFEKLSESTKKQLLNGENDQCVKEAIKRHFTTKESTCDLVFESRFKSENDYTFYIKKTPTLKIENATIVRPSLFAMNGVVHVIDKAFVDDNFLSWSYTVRNFDPNFADALENEHINGTVTILIPPRDSKINNTKNYIISNVVISSFSFQSSVTTDAGTTFPTYFPSFFSLFLTPDYSYYLEAQKIGAKRGWSTKERLTYQFGQIGCSRFTAEPIRSCNAQLYFIDKPLPIETQSINDYLASRADLTTFYEIWKRISFGLPGEMTLFVPHNDGFSPILLKKILETQQSIDAFVKPHIYKYFFCSFDLEVDPTEFTYPSIAGNHAKLSSENGTIVMNDARIKEADAIIRNGVIHILDSPLVDILAEMRKITKTQETDKAL